MKVLDIFYETYTALSANKVRSGLTMLGIIIGISSVIVLVSIGQGAQGSIEESIQTIGSNLIMITPGTQRGVGTQVSSGRGSSRTLTEEDAEAISELSLVKAVAPEISSRYQVTSKGKNTNTSVVGTTASYTSVKNVEMGEGSFITDQHVKNLSKVAVIGPDVQEDLFDEGTDPIGQTIKINGIQFKIIGITEEKGGTGMGSQDNMIFIPLSSAQKFLAGSSYLSTINVEAIDSNSMDTAQEEIEELLLERHNITNADLADFTIMNQTDIIDAASSVTETFTILLAAVASISLVVGGIGIMNMMLTTVTERTKEIGLRKAIGAKKKDINRQFIIEAMMLTFIGGVIGVAIGWIISFVVSQLGITQTKVSVSSVVLAFGVSAIIGIVFGYYPAKRAARLNPIDALKYE